MWLGSLAAQREFRQAQKQFAARLGAQKRGKKKGKRQKQQPQSRYQGSYAEYLLSPWWQKRRKRALKRAGYRCQQCRCRGMLHVHHLTYARLGQERNADLEVLCERCHAYRHEGIRAMDDHLRAIAGQ